MKKLLVILILGVLSQHLFCQLPVIDWQKCLGGTNNDFAASIIQTSDGGYISAGFSNSIDFDVTGNHGDNDVWVVKVNSTGVLQWQKSFGGSLSDNAHCVIQTSDGGYLISGNTESYDGNVTNNHTSSSGHYDSWLIKIDSLGVIQWQKCYGSTGSEEASSVLETSDGGYIFTGFNELNNGNVSGNHGNFDIWVVKVNSIGVLQWQKSFGGTGNDRGNKIIATNDGNFIICGYTGSFNGNVTSNNGADDVWIIKFSSIGNLIWQKCYGGTSYDQGYGISTTNDGGYIFVGNSYSNNGDVTLNKGGGDFWVVKINSTGLLQWQKCYGGSNLDLVAEIIQTVNGEYIVVGTTSSTNNDVIGNHGGSSDGWLLKLNSIGTILWQKCIGSYSGDGLQDIKKTNDGNIIVVGTGGSNNGDISGVHGGLYDLWLVKINPNYNCDNFHILTNGNYSTSVNSGNNVSSLPITVNSTSPLVYNWYLGGSLLTNGLNYQGVSTNQLTILNSNYSQDDNLNNFVCYISDNNTCKDTAYFNVDVCDDITIQPINTNSIINTNATFIVDHTDPSAAYQWQTDFGAGFQNITNAGQYSGANTNKLVISNVSLLNNNQYFYCRINSHCNATQYSDTVILLINNSTNSLSENQLENSIIINNPVLNDLTISSSALQEELNYIILNPIGEIVKTGSIKNKEEIINCDNLKNGLYILKVRELNNCIKFIKN